ncbi:MAG: MFS transporter [Candidatus Binatia bacterium]|nr:MFS transporter [Candidatus Binatia bacterium]
MSRRIAMGRRYHVCGGHLDDPARSLSSCAVFRNGRGEPVSLNRNEAAAAPTTSSAGRRVLLILWIVYVFNFVDRNILSILLEPIKQELGVSDTAMGFLTGFAFAVFYTVAGIPIARLADRRSRRVVMSIGVAFWSLATAASGFVQSFSQLALARIAVGVGEASATPAAHSLISDYFPPEQRTRAIAIYNTGANGGILVGLVLGGWLQQTFGWRVAFLVVGLPGLLVALLVAAFITEPPRGLSEGRDAAEEAPSLGESLRLLGGLRTYIHIAIAAGLYAMPNYGTIAWMPTFLIRVFGVGYAEIGLTLGMVLGFVGAAGTYLAGTLCDRLLRRDVRWLVWIPAIGSAVSVPFIAVTLLAPSFAFGMPFYAASVFFGASFAAPTYALVQALAPLRMRATASAVLLFALNLIGLGLGPTVVGILNDALAPRFGDEAIRYSLLFVSLLNIWGMVHSLIAARSVRADIEGAAAQ